MNSTRFSTWSCSTGPGSSPRSPGGWPAADLKYRFVWDAPFLISPHDHNAIYIGSQYVHVSTDGGNSWKVISPDLTLNDKSRQQSSGGLTPDNIGVEYSGVVFAIAESRLKPGLLWVGTNAGLNRLDASSGRFRRYRADAAEPGGVGGYPPHRGERVVRRRGVTVLRGVPVVHRHQHRSGARAQIPAERVVRIQAAQDPAAAVEVGDQRVRTFRRRPVEPVSEVPGRAGQHSVGCLANLRTRGQGGSGGLGEGSCVGDAHRLHRGQLQRSHEVEHHRHVRLDPADHPVVAP